MAEHQQQQHQSVISLQPHQEELLVLADLAGIKTPPNVMKILIELLGMNVQPAELHQLLRSILVSKSRSQRSAKHVTRRSTSSRLPDTGTDATPLATLPPTAKPASSTPSEPL